jgi:hypothetical protein
MPVSRAKKAARWPCHFNLDACLRTDIKKVPAFSGNEKAILFPIANGRTGTLSTRPMTQGDAYRMIAHPDTRGRNSEENRAFSPGQGDYENVAATVAAWRSQSKRRTMKSVRTTGLYDRRDDDISPVRAADDIR